MLLRFEVTNHRSIREPVELSTIAVDAERAAARSFPLLSEQVLTLAGIYGPNASGKSSVLDALVWLSAAARDSLRAWDTTVPRDPSKFGNGPSESSAYEVEMASQGVRYAYRLEVTDSEVLSESLVSYPKRQPRTLFEREGMDLHFRRGLQSASGTRDLLSPTTLVLSAMMRFAELEVLPFGRDLVDIVSLAVHGSGQQQAKPRSAGYPSTAQVIGDHFEAETPREIRDSAIAMMRFADLGIEDVRLVSEVQTVELDRTDLKFVQLFQDPATNPHGAQLIFTTHDTSLLNYLDRDEVWLTEKDDNGATTLTGLAEYKVRSSANLERAYLQGRFGAVPELDQIVLRRALGLAPGSEP